MDRDDKVNGVINIGVCIGTDKFWPQVWQLLKDIFLIICKKYYIENKRL